MPEQTPLPLYLQTALLCSMLRASTSLGGTHLLGLKVSKSIINPLRIEEAWNLAHGVTQLTHWGLALHPCRKVSVLVGILPHQAILVPALVAQAVALVELIGLKAFRRSGDLRRLIELELVKAR